MTDGKSSRENDAHMFFLLWIILVENNQILVMEPESFQPAWTINHVCARRSLAGLFQGERVHHKFWVRYDGYNWNLSDQKLAHYLHRNTVVRETKLESNFWWVRPFVLLQFWWVCRWTFFCHIDILDFHSRSSPFNMSDPSIFHRIPAEVSMLRFFTLFHRFSIDSQ